MKKTVLIALCSLSLFAQSSLEIAKKSFEVISGYGSSSSLTTMVLKNAQGVKNVRKLEIKKLEGENGDKSILTFLYPKDIKGTKLLSFEQIAKDDKQWLYLPALKRVKRISSRNKSGSFMASEFSYEDISSQNYKNYSYEGEALEVNVDGIKFFKIIRVPIDENSGYSKQIIFINAETYLAKNGEYFDKQGKLLKKVSFLEYQKLDGLWRVKVMKMFNVQNKKESALIWDEDKIKINVSKSEFSKRALK